MSTDMCSRPQPEGKCSGEGRRGISYPSPALPVVAFTILCFHNMSFKLQRKEQSNNLGLWFLLE